MNKEVKVYESEIPSNLAVQATRGFRGILNLSLCHSQSLKENVMV
jgi:hypothetical protein